MKKYNRWTVVFIAFLIIVGFYYLGKSSNKSESIDTKQKASMSADEIFANKIKCESFIEKLKENAMSMTSQYEIDAIYKVFYSQPLNTCVSEQYNLYYGHGTVKDGELLIINDVLTKENIWTSENYSPTLKYWDAEHILDTQAADYQ